MHVLEPKEFDNLDELEASYAFENLSADLVADLHARTRPFILRRTKAEVLQRPPPIVERIVSGIMAPLQRTLSENTFRNDPSFLLKLNAQNGSQVKFGPRNNVMMERQKIANHPYLIRGVEQEGSTHDPLVAASWKAIALIELLKRLRQEGHRILLFSNFTETLDLLEDILAGEGFAVCYLRLDGSVSTNLRPALIDNFNDPQAS
ncbi:hypothetical protein M427DRAFT_276599 [Gonapodya prolifera JEL478]|uniref:SNF2 N-terminal domain-containing protein n=1 Tax=Gonapodya prolifera (strain JEL478) TaxID=1344416 RepID=A0A139AY92_GONPJ|nr:hypothetical protein M427DRAFT_276599 [Gonapodya prolifera JEL478]|eukprot:KXS21689.1 hypothetical protein M427DRAFT_276599 [Gonapodya prolifera JEL478]